MANKSNTVRVVLTAKSGDLPIDQGISGTWVEQLRYMGVLRVLKDDEESTVLEFYAPKGANAEEWARQNAERMRSFSVNAVAASKWGG